MALDQSSTFIADNAGNPEPVTLLSGGARAVKIFENAGANTTSFIVHEPRMTSPGITIPNGGSYIFHCNSGRFYNCGEIAGYIETVEAGSAVFAQQELGGSAN